ncbi:MAG: pyrroloquinoline quinone-dependent dehydrogenase [Acidobacteria bacterium]|nr:pyrroloquinoline quinone-dependent dehydrogenase [Acidobacteriota bacterium]
MPDRTLTALLLLSQTGFAADAARYRDWRIYGGGHDSIRYSALKQINRTNAAKLKVAWTYDTGDAFNGSEMQCNPIVVDGVFFATTPKLKVIALDAATGALKWSFDPDDGRPVIGKRRNRGLVYWADGNDRRLFVSARQFLFALDARTGKPVPGFGANGRVDIREGLGRDPLTLNVTSTTPGVIYKDLLILPSLVPEDLPAAPGDIRAYDVRTGKIRWTFHTIPRPGEPGHETWPPDAWKYTGAANNWAGMALDETRGLIYAPTGSASYDFYGANRHGDNLYANSLLCLNAATGERVWHYQMIRHDVWDRDHPTPPSLVTLKMGGRQVDAVVQATKSGHLWVFDRVTGKPLFPVEERAVPASEVDGELLAKTQPLPLKPPPFSRQRLTEDMLTNRTPAARAAALEQFRKVQSAGQFAPPSFAGTIVFPGFDGGAEWGGQAFDPETGLYYVNANEMAWILRIVPRPRAQGTTDARGLYLRNCASCHRDDRKGTPPEFPALDTIARKLTEGELSTLIREGAGRMPAFAGLSREENRALTRWLLFGDETTVAATATRNTLKYRTDGYNKFLDPDGYPAIAPPWGTLTAYDLAKGDIRWQIPFGEHPALAAQGLKNTGSENYGGPVVTAGGVIFIGATNLDSKFHVFDKRTGKLLWETTLPAAGNATPAVYEVNGRQFVAIAAGGGKSGAKSGGSYVAFALAR